MWIYDVLKLVTSLRVKINFRNISNAFLRIFIKILQSTLGERVKCPRSDRE